MPNHIANIIRLTGEPDDVARLLNQIAYDDSSEQDIPSGVHSIDFNKIIPQPEDIGDGWYHLDTTPRKDHPTIFYWTDEQLMEYSAQHNNSHNYDHDAYPKVN